MGFIRISVVSAIALAAGLALAPPARAADTPVQLTEDHSGSACASFSPVSDATGTIAAWQSDCNTTGANADGSIEIFRAVVGSAPVQITSTNADCTSSDPSISADGNRIAFESNCDLTGGNVDGNVEIFLWKNGVLTQLTSSVGCDNLAPSINGPGTFIAFDSTCNAVGTNNNGRGSEIFRVSAAGAAAGGLKQLTTDAIGDCDSTSASISDDGKLVAFDSDCDLAGKNPDRAIEIFTVTLAGVVKQRTFAPDDACSSVRPSMDAGGTVLAFYSDCDFTGQNADRSDEIFTLTVDSAAVLRQVTDSGAGSPCANGEPHMASSGHAMAFSGYCKLNNSNGDGSVEVFQVGVGAAQGGILAVTDGDSCSSVGGGISADGTRVFFDSDCDPAANNADGSVEVFRVGACVCGAPSTRKDPHASDALFVLRAAVGSSSCALCECDSNSDSLITASDALRVLKFAVGQNLTLTCPVP